MNRDYKCMDCGLTYYLSLGRIKEDKPNALSFVCEVCLDIQWRTMPYSLSRGVWRGILLSKLVEEGEQIAHLDRQERDEYRIYLV